ncbi:MAG: 1,4-alpha-glucan-branching enzyme, partial [Cytophagales bacterium]|nr:1,4-alpha-glucan-branching enzyme [Cytophagales bacterium]
MPNSPAKLPLLQDDPWLEPYTQDIEERLARYKAKYTELEQEFGSLEQFADGYKYFGINFDKKANGWYYREWAPAAEQLFFIGDFNQWDRASHPMKKNDKGVWEIFLPFDQYKDKLTHGSHVKVHVIAANGHHDRIPAFIKRVVQDEVTHGFDGQHWEPKSEFKWKDEAFIPSQKELFIYECHIGLAQEKEGIGTYVEFAEHILPRIKKLGYNTLQFMAIQEHPYYGSYGYHVSNFFAPSSRFGTPEDLKYLVNKAHEMGFTVIMDIVHSHAVKNFAEGLNDFDGSNGQYFHEGSRGYHELWDSKLFNYGKREVLQFLLSNVKYWIEEFHFDGFRFDGITSMMYFHHGNYMDFDHYDKYFKLDVEWDAITYLQLANRLIHRLKAQAVSIAEDMSGMPGLCRKNEEGGLGFDYRLGMGIPDYWIKILKEKRDEDWNIHELWGVLTNRRWKEGTISYA